MNASPPPHPRPRPRADCVLGCCQSSRKVHEDYFFLPRVTSGHSSLPGLTRQSGDSDTLPPLLTRACHLTAPTPTALTIPSVTPLPCGRTVTPALPQQRSQLQETLQCREPTEPPPALSAELPRTWSCRAARTDGERDLWRTAPETPPHSAGPLRMLALGSILLWAFLLRKCKRFSCSCNHQQARADLRGRGNRDLVAAF